VLHFESPETGSLFAIVGELESARLRVVGEPFSRSAVSEVFEESVLEPDFASM
jgi:hypothetical protein